MILKDFQLRPRKHAAARAQKPVTLLRIAQADAPIWGETHRQVARDWGHPDIHLESDAP